MSNKKNKAENLPFPKVIDGKISKQELSKQEIKNPYCNARNKNSKKKKPTLPMCLGSYNGIKNRKKKTQSKTTKKKPQKSNGSPSSSDKISDSDLIVISETDSCASEKISSHCALSDISPTCHSKSEFLNQDERKLSPIKNINFTNNAQSSLGSESSSPLHHSQHVPYKPKCNISVSLNSNNLNVKENDKLTNYESTFLPTNTLPDIEINLGAEFDDFVGSDNAIDNPKLSTISNLLDINLINDTGQIVTKDMLHDIADSNNYLSLKNYFMLLINTTGNFNENLVCNHLKIEPLIKPSDFNYEKNKAFEIAVDISTLKAANDYIKENASKFEAFSVFSSNDVHNLEKPSDLSMNFIDSNDFNLEDTESELSICSYKTADIQPEFFDMTFSENPETVLEKCSLEKLNPDAEVCSLELNTSATEVCHNGSQNLSENNDVVNDITDKLSRKVPSKGKKRRKKNWSSHSKRRCHRRNNHNSVPELENAQNEDLCDTCDDSELEEVITESFSRKVISDVEKCKDLEKVSVVGSINEGQFKNVKQKREKSNKDKKISKKKNAYHEAENNKETVSNSSSDEILILCDTHDDELATKGNSQRNIVSRIIVENVIGSYGQDDVIVENTSDELSDKPTLETASHLSCNGEIEISSNVNTDSEICNNKSKKKKLEKNHYQNSNESIKCSIDLKILKDNLNDTSPCSNNGADVCNSEVKSKDKCNSLLQNKKALDEVLGKTLIIKLYRVEEFLRLEEFLSPEDVSDFAHSSQNFSETVVQLTNVDDTSTNNATALQKNSSPKKLDKCNKHSSESLFETCLCNSGDCTSECNCRVIKSPIKCSSQKTGFVSSDCSPSSLNKNDDNSNSQPTYIDNDSNIKIDDTQCQNLKDVKCSPSAENNSPNKKKICKFPKKVSDIENSSVALESHLNDSAQDCNNKVMIPVKVFIKRCDTQSEKSFSSTIASAISSNNLKIPTSKSSTARSKNTTKQSRLKPENVGKQSSKLKSTVRKNSNVIKMSAAKKKNITSMKYIPGHLTNNDCLLSEGDSQNIKDTNSKSSPCLNKDIPITESNNSITESESNEGVTSLLANNAATDVQGTSSPTSQAVSEDFEKVISKVSSLSKSPFTESKKHAQTFENKHEISPEIIQIQQNVCSLVSESDCQKSTNSKTGSTSEFPSRKTKRALKTKSPIEKQSVIWTQNSPCRNKEITPLVSQNNLDYLKSPNKATHTETLKHTINEENLDIHEKVRKKKVNSNLKKSTKAKASLKHSKCRKFPESSDDESQNTNREEKLNSSPCKDKEITPLVSQNYLNCLKSPNKTTHTETLKHTINEENLDIHEKVRKKKVNSNLKKSTIAKASLKHSKCRKFLESSDNESQNTNREEKLNSPSPKKDVSISNSKVGKNAFIVEKLCLDKDLVNNNTSPMQDVTLSKECTVSLSANKNVGDVDCGDTRLNILKVQNSDDKDSKKQSTIERKTISTVKNESQVKVKPLKKKSLKCTESTEIPIKVPENKTLKDCEAKKSDNNNVKEKIAKPGNNKKPKKVNSKISLSKSNGSHSIQILKDKSSVPENLDIQVSSNVDSNLNKESIFTEIVHCENMVSKLSSEEKSESTNQNKELQKESTAQTKFHIDLSAKSPKLSTENDDYETNSNYTDAILLTEEDLDFEPDQVDDSRNEGSAFSKPSISEMPPGDCSKDNLELPSQNQLKTNLDKTIESELNASGHMICGNESSHSFPFEQLINNFNTCPSKMDLLSEDDSDTDVEHSFKRSHYNGPPFGCTNKSSEELCKFQTIPNKESCLKNSNDDCQNVVSNNESCKPSSGNSNVSRISCLEDVGTRIKQCCEATLYNDAMNIARTYITISPSSDASRAIIKKLLSNFFLSIKNSNAKDNTDFKVFDDVLQLMHDFNLYDKLLSSYFIDKCCMHADLNIYSIKMFHICQSKKIPLNSKAIDAYSLFLKSEKMSLSVLLNFLNFVKSLCNKKVSKDLTHLAFEKSKTCKFDELHEMCAFLCHITPMEVDKLDLEGFLQLCFKKRMWSYVAEMFMMWNYKQNLASCIFVALSKENEDMGNYFLKFAEAVHGQETSLHPKLKVVFGDMGTCLMMNAFFKKPLRIALEILRTLHTYNVNYSETYFSDDHKKTSFNFVFISIDICLNSKRPKDAFTIFQEFSWITPPDDLNETEKKYVLKEKYQRLFKLVPLLNNGVFLSEGWEALKQLLVGVEQDLSQETLEEKASELRAVYNKYLISLLNSGKISSAFDLYKHSTGPKKDIFVFTPSVLRGLVVAFYECDFCEANFLFTIGIMKKVYPIKKPEPGNFPWHLTIWSNWTVTEIKLAIEWFIGTLFPLLMSRPKDTEYEKWFSFKIIFKVVDSKKKASSKIHCLLESQADSNYYIKKTKDILETMDPSLQYVEETDGLCITPDSLYNYWINRYPDASSTFPCYTTLLSKGKRSFGSEEIPSNEEKTEDNLNKSQFQGGHFEAPAEINEIRTNSLKHSYSPVTPKCSPSGRMNDSSGSCTVPRSKIFSPDNSETSNPTQKLSVVNQTSIPNRLSDASVHDKQQKSPNKKYIFGNDNRTLQSKIQLPDLKSATSSRIDTNATHFVEDNLKERDVGRQSINNLRKTSPDIIPAISNKPITGSPCSSNSIKRTLPDKQSSKRQCLNSRVKDKLATFDTPSSISNSFIKKKPVIAPKVISRKKNQKLLETLTICLKNNSSVRTVSSGEPVLPLTTLKNVKTNQKNLSNNEGKIAKFSVEEPATQNTLEAHVAIPQKISALSTNLEPAIVTKQIKNVSHIPTQNTKMSQPMTSKPLLKINSDVPLTKNVIFDTTKVYTVKDLAASNSDASIVPVIFRKKEQKDDPQKMNIVSINSKKDGTSYSDRSRSCSNEDFKKISSFLLSQLKMKLKCENLTEEQLKCRADKLADEFIENKKLMTLDKKAIKDLNDFSKCST